MRLYTFVNMYLSSIQHGIQTAHVVSELYEKYRSIDVKKYGSLSRDNLYDWGRNHKTIIVLNGGFSDNLDDICHELSNQDLYPYAKFVEGKAELRGATTAVGIVLPKSVYDIGKLREEFGGTMKGCNVDECVYDIICKYKLA
jgi:hypothetical protein